MSLRAFRSLERGEALDPHYSTLQGIADALSVSVSELVGESAPPKAEALAPVTPLRESLRALPDETRRSVFLGALAAESGTWVAGTVSGDLEELKRFMASTNVQSPGLVLEAVYELWPESQELAEHVEARAREEAQRTNDELAQSGAFSDESRRRRHGA